MFSYRELQTLISGADHEINIDDLEQNTKYGNGFTSTHETILNFWNVVKSFTESQKRKLLKFVTSCSRPPLLGFKVSYETKEKRYKNARTLTLINQRPRKSTPLCGAVKRAQQSASVLRAKVGVTHHHLVVAGTGPSVLHSKRWRRARTSSNGQHLHEFTQVARFQGSENAEDQTIICCRVRGRL